MKIAKPNQGGTMLVPADAWVQPSDIQGTDRDVIDHPMMERAFLAVLDKHIVRHDIAVMSLCTARRPYSRTPKWKRIRRVFGMYADLIVTSNGGVVPIAFEAQYPFMTYDAKGERANDDHYKAALEQRLVRFFTRHRYRYALFVYQPRLRNVPAARAAAEALVAGGHLDGFAIGPSVAVYRDIVSGHPMPAKRPGGKMAQAYQYDGFNLFPELHPLAMPELLGHVRRWREV